ncbi:MAG: enoyl-CoA hydratase [Pseudohongiellaceae bacterium]
MTTDQEPNILQHRHDGVLTLQIRRPEKKNALTRSMYRALAEGLRSADADDEVRVVLIRGEEDCFTSGNDVNDFVNVPDADEERPSVQFMQAISGARKPVIAAVGGLAIGIGTTLLFHCDLVYAGENAFMQLPFTRLGLCPEAGSSYLLPLIAGHQRASELLLLGERFSAQKAQEFGIVNEVLPDAGYLEHAMNRALELAGLPGEAVQTSKALIKASQQPTLTGVIDTELAEFSRLLQTDEAQAIMQSFLNRRK